MSAPSLPADTTNSISEPAMAWYNARSLVELPRLRLQMEAPLTSAYRIAWIRVSSLIYRRAALTGANRFEGSSITRRSVSRFSRAPP